ncbi:gliding motility protein GldM [Persicobacter sp. CCB-QB2]|uniref:type IX secretion system motor protein PorM/GldM n=1 Tax=Persicobacter sp. CCB-QB2 TaxID=1561025 RepID=UPI0006A99DA1|nr:gliding motility protein GldM [Persicobacter sp. CCB-QB2]
MAGGKETPRQQLIGLMYIVFLALIAMQVSGSVMEKFHIINQSLIRSNNETNVSNGILVDKAMKAKVDESGREQDKLVLQKAREVRELTSKALNYVDGLKDELTEKTGGIDEATGLPKGMTDEDKVANWFIQQKKGDEVKEQLNAYVAGIREVAGSVDVNVDLKDIALEPGDMPEYANNKEVRKKDFKSFNFEHTPMISVLASLSQFESEILAREAQTLKALGDKIGAGTIQFDEIVPMVLPESQVVAAGAKYKAQMFIAASSSGIKPTMALNNKQIKVNADGKGEVEFTATPGKYDKDGLARKTFKATISIPKAGGEAEKFEQEIEYFVAKPVIQIQSASVQALYLNCGNELNVQVPALGSAYQPSFRAKGGKTFAGSKKGIVTVVPNSKAVALTVSSGGNVIGTENFKVRQIPLPTIEIFNMKGKKVNLKNGESSANMRKVRLQATPDKSFAEFLPNDSKYRIQEAEITLAQGSRPVAKPIKVTNGQADLGAIMGKAKAGMRLVVEVKKVVRKNFRNEIEVVDMGADVVTNIAISN